LTWTLTCRESIGNKKINVDEVLNYIHSINKDNCKNKSPEDLQLKGDISYGADEQFENEALMAVRTANFISAFLQVVDPKEIFPGTRVVDDPLTEDQMIGEALAIVMGNTRIMSAGIYFDENQFMVKPPRNGNGRSEDPRHSTRAYFAPLAYKTELNTRKFEVEDLARLNTSDLIYTNQPWFKEIKSRWSNYYDSLEKHWLKMYFRSRDGVNKTKGNSADYGDSAVPDPLYLRRYEHFPEYYRAANKDHGLWTAPYFDCHGLVPKWKITYVSPFFGFNSLRNRIEFKGAVAVSMDIKMLDVNQCPSDYTVPNAFKRTHKCDDKTSYCVPIPGRKFGTGGYKCECRQGYEYPFEDAVTYYDGQRLDDEFLNLVEGKPNWFDMFKCRLAGAAGLSDPFTVILFLSLLLLVLKPVLHR